MLVKKRPKSLHAITFLKEEGMSLSRREFVKLCSAGVAGLGISQIYHPGILHAMTEGAKKAPVIWVQGQGCTGCSVSLLNAVHPRIKEILLDVISLEFHPTVMASEGEMALAHMYEIAEKFKGNFFLLVEGAIPTAKEGRYCIVGETLDAKGQHHEVTMAELIRDLAPKSLATVGIGTCSAYGGIPAAAGNVTEAKSLRDFFAAEKIDKLLVNVPGCPPHPDWMVGTLVAAWSHVLNPKEHPLPELDADGRPMLFFGDNIHENCPYLDKYEASDFAPTFTKPGCKAELGCKGPSTMADCAKRRWNNGINWCVENAVCIGCVEPDFPDGKSPFYVAE